jgi:hypothetical protein
MSIQRKIAGWSLLFLLMSPLFSSQAFAASQAESGTVLTAVFAVS